MTKVVAKLPLPLGLQFKEWGAVVAEQLSSFGVSAPLDDAAWKEWACALFYVPELAAAPTPMEFETWSGWADRFVETFS